MDVSYCKLLHTTDTDNLLRRWKIHQIIDLHKIIDNVNDDKVFVNDFILYTLTFLKK